MLIGQEEFLPKIIVPNQNTTTHTDAVHFEYDESKSSRENMRRRRAINRRLNYSVAWKAYMGSNDIMYK